MKFSEKWLREWTNPDVGTDELVSQLTMAGLEVDSADPVAGEFSGLVVAEILEAEQHPDADKLRVCKVNAGSGDPLQIVCGAPNARAGLKAPLATVGGVMPGDFKIKKAKLRGIESFGMLCSASELGLAESSDGLLEFASDAPVGVDVREYLGLDDVSIDVDLTPNRGDCNSVAGVAREVGVLTRTEFAGPEIKPVDASIDDTFPVRVDAPADCPRYLGRVIKGVNPEAETPLWMQEKLRRSGLRSLGPGVDVTNYVLLELGQPMHAFDLKQLNDGIVVRRASEGESLTLLDGKEVALNTDTLVICDASGPVAMAGIMGGEKSGVADDTDTLFLECAYFSPESIAGRARAYGLHTDASYRYERGVDPALQEKAVDRATALLLEICGGEAGPVVVTESAEHVPSKTPVKLRRKRIKQVLGVEFSDEHVVEMLERLGMAVEPREDGWRVTPPSFRFDISIEVDLIEELGRIYGYDNIPTSLPIAPMMMPEHSETVVEMSLLKRRMVDRGYQEAITYSFVDPAWQKAIDPHIEPVALANPLSSELSVMRTSLWPGLVAAMAYNRNRQQSRVRLFETGKVFLEDGQGGLLQRERIAGVAIGTQFAEQWSLKGGKVDFYDAKADVEALLADAAGEVSFAAEAHDALHPGQSAGVYLSGERIGWIGVLHPELEKRLDAKGAPVLFELDAEAICHGQAPVFKPLSKFPSIRRDLAFVVDEKVQAQAMLEKAKSVAGEQLERAFVFDIYRGEGVESGRKSLAIGLILQDSSRTLTDEDIAETVSVIVESLQNEFAASLRAS
ncbi:MAG: phenylalanine--tRNA ligase subunit beta [Gammaproteobacteria bacterium]